MRFVGLARVVAIVSSLTVTACTPPAVTRPIGIRAGSTVYRVSCRTEIACNAEIAKTCAAGHFITASGGTTLDRSTKHPYGLEFVCRPSKLLAADYVARQPAIQVLITPECKDMFYGPDFLDRDANGNPVRTEKRPEPDYVPWDPGRAIPITFARSESILPGESKEVDIEFLNGPGLMDALRSGRSWRIQEGPKLVATATLIEILILPQQSGPRPG